MIFEIGTQRYVAAEMGLSANFKVRVKNGDVVRELPLPSSDGTVISLIH